MYDSDDRGGVRVLRLHVGADGLVWYGHDSLPADCTGRPAAEFSQDAGSFDLGLDRAKSVRLVGVAANAALVIGLTRLHRTHPKLSAAQEILLGSPLVCPGPGRLASPQAVLQALWQPAATASAPGCWHLMGPREYTTYAIVTELAATGGHPSELARRSLRYHPAWPALSFLAGLDEDAACRLVATVVDPRWFRHPFRPGRLSRLNAFLGLTPANTAAYVAGVAGDRHADRARTVLDTWAGGFRHATAGPTGFLHRVAARAPAGEYHVGLLRASVRFVRFLFEVWTAETAGDPEVRFDPALFFKSPDEREAYADHRGRLRV